jgi:large subunit ribosomal protein L10
MRDEKKYLVDETSAYLDNSDYLFLMNYRGVNVNEIAELRASLEKLDAEFHVVKNRIFNIAVNQHNYPDLKKWLKGQTAIVSGGKNPSEIAKVLRKFFQEKEKIELKIGVLDKKLITNEQFKELANLPSLEVLYAQLLGLLNTPAQRMLNVLQATPQALLNVLDAKVRNPEEN